MDSWFPTCIGDRSAANRDRRRASESIAMQDYSRDILVVLDHLKIEKIIVAGISMGDCITMQILRDARASGPFQDGRRDR